MLIFFLASALAIEPWFQNLQHYGPTSTEGWKARPMELVSTWCYAISLTVNAGDEFLFVSTVPPPYPPLGSLNWKQGKIGCGQPRDDGNDEENVFTYRVLPGGQSGRYPASGSVGITVCTGPIQTIALNYTDADVARAPVILPDAASVVSGGSLFAVLVQVDEFKASMLGVTNGNVTSVSGSDLSTRVEIQSLCDECVVRITYGTAKYNVFVTKNILADGECETNIFCCI